MSTDCIELILDIKYMHFLSACIRII